MQQSKYVFFQDYKTKPVFKCIAMVQDLIHDKNVNLFDYLRTGKSARGIQFICGGSRVHTKD